MTHYELPEYINGVPNICGSEDLVNQAMARAGPIYLPESGIDFGRMRSAFSIALHMHQPLIPAGGSDLGTAAVISNLQYMLDYRHIGDNRYNARYFAWCYKRMGEFIPQLIHEGKQPRVMLDYSGCLLHGLRAMGLHDVSTASRRSPAIRPTAAAWSGWAPPGATRWRLPRRCRTFGCTCGPGSTTLPPSSGWRR